MRRHLFAATLLFGGACLQVAAVPPVVLWYAPFLSGGGYSSEAHSYVKAIASALNQPSRSADHDAASSTAGQAVSSSASSASNDGSAEHPEMEKPFVLKVTQHGDSMNPRFIDAMPEEMRELMEEHWVEERDFEWSLKGMKVAIAICHSEPGAWHPPHYRTTRCPPREARYRVGRTMFETDRVPSGWADRMNKLDEIWVPTRFQEDVFKAGGVRPEMIKIVPEAVDVQFFDPNAVEAPYDLASEVDFELTDKTTVFLSIFKWERRKGWEVLLEAYFKAFEHGDDVVLVLLTNAYHEAFDSAGDFTQVIEKFTMSTLGKKLNELPRVHVLPPHIPQDAMPSLYKAATAFVLPSRGEGWGRPHVEAMAMELPVIATFWSGTTEYMTPENSYPLEINGLVEIPDGAFRGHRWADPSVEHLQKLLQQVKLHPEEAIAKGKQARQDMLDKYSPEVIGELIFDHITRILALVRAQDKKEVDKDEAAIGHEEL